MLTYSLLVIERLRPRPETEVTFPWARAMRGHFLSLLLCSPVLVVVTLVSRVRRTPALLFQQTGALASCAESWAGACPEATIALADF
jgi:hypothetical protein